MKQIKFGTDGWRAIIAKDFTTENVARVSEGTALWALSKTSSPVVVVGHDCRFGGELFTEVVAKILAFHNIKVLLAKGFVSTPMISLGVLKNNAFLGVVITASHNPPEYNGYKLKGSYGGPLLEEDIHDVETFIPDKSSYDIDSCSLESLIDKGIVENVDLETLYCNYLEEKFDLNQIRESKWQFAFDAMYGSGQNVMRRLFPDITLLHCERQPLFNGIPPEPLMRNLGEFSEVINLSGEIDCGLAVDGDADRTALFDNQGNYIDSHHVILLLIYYLHHYKGMKGKVATGFSSSVKINRLCEAFKIPLEIVKIGFKHIAGLMLKETILVGGEESGGITVAGHIPERDGIYNGLVIWEAMVKTGKSLRQLIDDVYAITGSFAFERSDLKLSQTDKDRIVENCNNKAYSKFGKWQVVREENLDGFKYYLSDTQWFMIRPSGTEPVLRTYAEGATKLEALEILLDGYNTIMNQKP
ncbi:MAG TPA: phosphoglucosamine mutase [Bacteroidales bacterium]|nr:phosphoglucosamine mutase [Bacteroidales bacterium]